MAAEGIFEGGGGRGTVLLQEEATPGAHYPRLQAGDGLHGVGVSVLVSIGDLRPSAII